MPQSHSKKILIVPLDWGLGHTTRCIPIIQEMRNQGCEIHVGGTEVTNILLQKEFPNLTYHSYPSYGVSYTVKASAFLWSIIKQMPRVAKVVRAEKQITRLLNKKHGFDIIISDNRFGVRDSMSKNVFITHQLNVLVPQSSILQAITNFFNHKYINQYDKILVPDVAQQILSGKLTNMTGIKKQIVYLGNLSRWNKSDDIVQVEKGSVLAILSGPEPQRTMLENKLIEQSSLFKGKLTIVRAKPKGKSTPIVEGVNFYNHLRADQLRQKVLEHDVIISRAGYSTIMDLVAVKKHAILIPTPGQTEQEYLSNYLAEQCLFHFYNQKNFELEKAVATFHETSWGEFPDLENDLRAIIAELIK